MRISGRKSELAGGNGGSRRKSELPEQNRRKWELVGEIMVSGRKWELAGEMGVNGVSGRKWELAGENGVNGVSGRIWELAMGNLG